MELELIPQLYLERELLPQLIPDDEEEDDDDEEDDDFISIS